MAIKTDQVLCKSDVRKIKAMVMKVLHADTDLEMSGHWYNEMTNSPASKRVIKIKYLYGNDQTKIFNAIRRMGIRAEKYNAFCAYTNSHNVQAVRVYYWPLLERVELTAEQRNEGMSPWQRA
jgi:hypothetical protein